MSSSKCEFVQKVPKCHINIFKIGSTKAAALLHDAHELFDKKDSKADENIRKLEKMSALPQAIGVTLQ